MSRKTTRVNDTPGEKHRSIPSQVPPRVFMEAGGKSRITMRVDNDVLAVFKARAEEAGGSYQTMMNEALKQFAHGLTLSEMIREAIHETLLSTAEKPEQKRARKRTAG